MTDSIESSRIVRMRLACGPDAGPLKGFVARVSLPLLEGFLAVLGERSRFAGDTAVRRRCDAMAALRRLCLVETAAGAIEVSVQRTNPRLPPDPLGFLDTYDPDRVEIDGEHLARLRLALSLFRTPAGSVMAIV